MPIADPSCSTKKWQFYVVHPVHKSNTLKCLQSTWMFVFCFYLRVRLSFYINIVGWDNNANHLTSNPPHPLSLPSVQTFRVFGFQIYHWFVCTSSTFYSLALSILVYFYRCPMCAWGECVCSCMLRECAVHQIQPVTCVQIFCSFILFASCPIRAEWFLTIIVGLALCFSVFTLYIQKFHEKQTSFNSCLLLLVTILISEDLPVMCINISSHSFLFLLLMLSSDEEKVLNSNTVQFIAIFLFMCFACP